MKRAKDEAECRKSRTDTTMLTEQIKMEKRLEDRWLKNRWHFERKEAEEERNLALAKESQEWRVKELEQEEKLASEMVTKKRNDFRALKMRQQLRECDELRDLEAKLRTAYILKERAHQIEQNKLRKLQSDIKEREYAADRAAEIASRECEQQRAIEEAKKTKEYREFLQDQIINKSKAKQEEFKMFLLEKGLIDDAVRTILEEDRKEEEARIFRNKKNKEEIQAMIEARKLWMIKEKEEQEAEDRRIRDYLEKKFLDEKALQEKTRIERENLQKQQESIARMLAQEESKRKDREEMLHIITENEIRKRLENEDHKKIEDAIRKKFEMNTIFAKQIEERLAKLNEDSKKDEEYTKKIVAQRMAESKLEEVSAEKQRQQKIEYLRQLKTDIEERQQRKLIEAQSEKTHLELEEKAREERQRLIEQERIRLLQEHAEKLVGYLPRGLLRESDIPFLGSEVQKYYKQSV